MFPSRKWGQQLTRQGEGKEKEERHLHVPGKFVSLSTLTCYGTEAQGRRRGRGKSFLRRLAPISTIFYFSVSWASSPPFSTSLFIRDAREEGARPNSRKEGRRRRRKSASKLLPPPFHPPLSLPPHHETSAKAHLCSKEVTEGGGGGGLSNFEVEGPPSLALLPSLPSSRLLFTGTLG